MTNQCGSWCEKRYEPRHDKTNKVSVWPAKTQISLGIRPVWSESSLSAWKKLGSLAAQWVHSEDWSDWADAQADLSLRWAHMPFCWFCHEAAQMWSDFSIKWETLPVGFKTRTHHMTTVSLTIIASSSSFRYPLCYSAITCIGTWKS